MEDNISEKRADFSEGKDSIVSVVSTVETVLPSLETVLPSLEKVRDASVTVLDDLLRRWVEYQESNGIKQQTAEWHVARQATIGGSSMATIQGINPYSDVENLIRERVGLKMFNGDIKPQWGNLFEDVIKRFVEHKLQCVIRGEDLYVLGEPCTSYSPDGLAVVSRAEVLKHCRNYDPDDFRAYPKHEIALMEFKCPYSRIPNGTAPKYYVPQVLMGLDLLSKVCSVSASFPPMSPPGGCTDSSVKRTILPSETSTEEKSTLDSPKILDAQPTLGIYVEGVIRRCTWEQLGLNPAYDTTLVARSSGAAQAYGINGFYIDRTALAKTAVSTLPLFSRYLEHYIEFGDASNEYISNDLGEAPVDLFTLIMSAMDKRLISIRYYNIHYDEHCEEALNDDLSAHIEYCRAGNHINIGILPWKIFRADFHIIDKVHNYLAQWYPMICEIVGVITQCNGRTPEEQNQIICKYCGSSSAEGDKKPKSYQRASQPSGFSDD